MLPPFPPTCFAKPGAAARESTPGATLTIQLLIWDRTALG